MIYMASYLQYQPQKYDEFPTPIEVWEHIKSIIPTDKVIWCPFYCDGGHTLKDLGFDIIHENEDFFEHNKGDIIIDNPPFSLKKDILQRCFELDKPFILILPVSTICYKYFRQHKDKHLQIIIPPKRWNFKPEAKSSATFDTIYLCYKMSLPKDINFL